MVDRLIEALGLNLFYKNCYSKDKKTERERKVCRIRFKNIQMKNNILSQGYIPSRLKKTNFPSLENREFDLAFLLGFFDGDGKEGTTKMHIASKKILEKIHNKFNVPHKVRTENDGTFSLSLGGKLFNDILENYQKSLERKRKFFNISARKILLEKISKKELKRLVWEAPLKELAKNLGVHYRAISDLADEWEIERPPSHYWHRKQNKKKL